MRPITNPSFGRAVTDHGYLKCAKIAMQNTRNMRDMLLRRVNEVIWIDYMDLHNTANKLSHFK